MTLHNVLLFIASVSPAAKKESCVNSGFPFPPYPVLIFKEIRPSISKQFFPNLLSDHQKRLLTGCQNTSPLPDGTGTVRFIVQLFGCKGAKCFSGGWKSSCLQFPVFGELNYLKKNVKCSLSSQTVVCVYNLPSLM